VLHCSEDVTRDTCMELGRGCENAPPLLSRLSRAYRTPDYGAQSLLIPCNLSQSVSATSLSYITYPRPASNRRPFECERRGIVRHRRLPPAPPYHTSMASKTWPITPAYIASACHTFQPRQPALWPFWTLLDIPAGYRYRQPQADWRRTEHFNGRLSPQPEAWASLSVAQGPSNPATTCRLGWPKRPKFSGCGSENRCSSPPWRITSPRRKCTRAVTLILLVYGMDHWRWALVMSTMGCEVSARYVLIGVDDKRAGVCIASIPCTPGTLLHWSGVRYPDL